MVNCFWEFIKTKKGEVFNIGGGLYSNCSILEAIDIIEKFTNKKIKTYVNKKTELEIISGMYLI